MDNIDPEKLRELYPQAYWAGYRTGRAEALTDPALRKQIAEEYLKQNLTQPSPSQQRPEASPRVPAATSADVPAGPLEEARAIGQAVQARREQQKITPPSAR